MPALHHVALRTRDVVGLTQFYQTVLEFEVVREQPGYSVWLRLGDAVLMIEQATALEPGIPQNTMDLLCFAVNEPTREVVRNRLATLQKPLEGETGYTTYFRDPDGRRVGVSTYVFTDVRQTHASDPEGEPACRAENDASDPQRYIR
jgi:glyoxylase I family protein